MRAAVLLLSLVGAARAQAVGLVDFEKTEPADGWRSSRLRLIETRVEDEGSTASDGRALRIESKEPGGYLMRPAPVRDWRRFAAVGFFARVEAPEPVAMRFRAIRGNGPAWRVRRFRLEPGDWREIVLPLKDFRENTRDQVCGFERIDRFMLKWDAGGGAVTIDDLRLLPGERGEDSCLPTTEDHLRWAFPEGQGKAYESEHFVLVTDHPRLQAKADGILRRFENGLACLIADFGVPPPPRGERAPVYLFAEKEGMHACVRRLGDHFGVAIDLSPRKTAMAFLSRGLCCYVEEWDWDRPSFVHYAMIAALYRALGITSQPNWINSGLADVVQLRQYPELLDDVDLADTFRRRKRGKGPFLEWDVLFAEGGIRHRLQYFTIFSYLARDHREEMPEVWRAVRGLTHPLHEDAPGAIATVIGMSLEEMEKAWLDSGLEHYGAK